MDEGKPILEPRAAAPELERASEQANEPCAFGDVSQRLGGIVIDPAATVRLTFAHQNFNW